MLTLASESPKANPEPLPLLTPGLVRAQTQHTKQAQRQLSMVPAPWRRQRRCRGMVGGAPKTGRGMPRIANCCIARCESNTGKVTRRQKQSDATTLPITHPCQTPTRASSHNGQTLCGKSKVCKRPA